MAGCYPFYVKHQQATARVIPPLLMRPYEAIPAFSISDLSGPI